MAIYDNVLQEAGIGDLQCNMEELMESFTFDYVSRLPEQQIKEFVESDYAQTMLEAGKFKKNTLVRLSKTDDLSRRITMAAMQLAKDNNDPLFDKLALNRVKERQLLDAINQKYESKATRVAKVGQMEWVKTSKMPLGFAKK